MADNRNQHVVPAFYIGFFKADEHNVYVKIKGIDLIYRKSPASQGYEEDAFTVMSNGERDTSCDNANKAIENRCAPRLTHLVGTSPPTDDEWQAIFFLAANLISRSRRTRDQNAQQLERVQTALPDVINALKELPPLPEAVRHFGLSEKELDDVPGVLARAAEVQYPLTAALGAEAIAKELKTGKDCDILVAPPGSTFITSDEPALILDNGKPAIMSLAEGFLARPDVEVFLPLKPDLACLWSHKSSRATRTITAAEIAGYNRLIWENCYERAFASRKSDLEQL